MNRNYDTIYEAVVNLKSLTKLPIAVERSGANDDITIRIKTTNFIVEAKSAMRASNQGVVMSNLKSLSKSVHKPLIFVAEYISKTAAEKLRDTGINYLDIAGNAWINNNDLFICIEGQKRSTKQRRNQSRAFQEAGLKILFFILQAPENIDLPYRDMAKGAGVALGTVSNVMAELEKLNFVLKTKERRILKNKQKLLERWMVEYNANLKPHILRSNMKFIKPAGDENWQKIDLNTYNGEILWGGEAAAAVLTGKLKPEKFIIYSNMELPVIAKSLYLVPDPDGNVEVVQKFWHDEVRDKTIVPTLLIYADLINSGFGRNIEVANYIRNNELQHIQ